MAFKRSAVRSRLSPPQRKPRRKSWFSFLRKAPVSGRNGGLYVLFFCFRAALRQLRRALRFLRDGGDERFGQLAPAPVLDIEVPDGAEHHRADEVHEQVLHGVVQPDVQIAAEAQFLPIDGHRGDAVDGHRDVAVGGVQHDGGDGVHDGVLLHIHVEEPVHAELEELPQHAHGHGEAEGRQRHVDRGQLELDTAVAVQNVDECEARGCAEKAGGGVEHGVPVVVGDEVAFQFAQYLRGEDEQENDDLQGGRQLDAEVLLDEEGQHKQHQHQKADERAFVFAADDGGYQRGQHDQPQHRIYGEHGGLALDDGLQLCAGGRGFGVSFHGAVPFCAMVFGIVYRKKRRITSPAVMNKAPVQTGPGLCAGLCTYFVPKMRSPASPRPGTI